MEPEFEVSYTGDYVKSILKGDQHIEVATRLWTAIAAEFR